jgi:hypothetical protein
VNRLFEVFDDAGFWFGSRSATIVGFNFGAKLYQRLYGRHRLYKKNS